MRENKKKGFITTRLLIKFLLSVNQNAQFAVDDALYLSESHDELPTRATLSTLGALINYNRV